MRMNYVRTQQRVEVFFLITVTVIGLGLFGYLLMLRQPVDASIAAPKRQIAVGNVNLYSLWVATNQARADAKVPPLMLGQGLTVAAAAKCADMVAKNYWDHNDPSGNPPWHFLGQAGVTYKMSAENLTQGYSHTSTIIQAWLASTEYKSNLLNPAYTQTGFAACKSANFQHKGPKLFVVQFLAN